MRPGRKGGTRKLGKKVCKVGLAEKKGGRKKEEHTSRKFWVQRGGRVMTKAEAKKISYERS